MENIKQVSKEIELLQKRNELIKKELDDKYAILKIRVNIAINVLDVNLGLLKSL